MTDEHAPVAVPQGYACGHCEEPWPCQDAAGGLADPSTGRWTPRDSHPHCIIRDDGAEVCCYGPPGTGDTADDALAVEVAAALNAERPDPTKHPRFKDVAEWLTVPGRTFFLNGVVYKIVEDEVDDDAERPDPATSEVTADEARLYGENDALRAMVEDCRELVAEMDNGDPNDDLTLGWRDALAEIVGYPPGYRAALIREQETP